jgi:hypothetical protein
MHPHENPRCTGDVGSADIAGEDWPPLPALEAGIWPVPFGAPFSDAQTIPV